MCWTVGKSNFAIPQATSRANFNKDDFIWRMCVFYRGFKKVTQPVKYPIPCCDGAITLILVGSNTIYIITVDANQGYHKIAVYVLRQEKISSLAPNNRKYAFKLMPFEPMNAPEFYTCMMQDFHAK